MSVSKNLSVPERLDRLEHAMQVVLTALHPRSPAVPPKAERNEPRLNQETMVLHTWIHSILHAELDGFGGRLDPPTS